MFVAFSTHMLAATLANRKDGLRYEMNGKTNMKGWLLSLIF